MAKKKSSLIMARDPQIMETGIKTSKGTLKFNGATSMHVSDPGLVAEIEHTVGRTGNGQVWTHQDEMVEHHKTYKEGVHTYHFGASANYAKAYEEMMERRRLRNAVQPK